MVSKDDFVRVKNIEEYHEYLAVHFFPGLAEFSVQAANDEADEDSRLQSPPARLLSVPRIRQVRSEPCSIGGDMSHVSGACYEPGEYVKDFGEIDPATGEKAFQYQTAAELQESWHFSYQGGLYGGGGFILPNISQYLVADTDLESPGTEFYQFPHEKQDLSALEDSGWIDQQTMAVFHDFTVYSPQMDIFCSVRMVLERGPEHGMFSSHVSIRVVELYTFPHFNYIKEIAFVVFVCCLAFGELIEFVACYSNPKKIVIEAMVEQRFQLRLKCLNYAAFQGCLEYNPNQVMEQLTHRLHIVYQEDSAEGNDDDDDGEESFIPSGEHIAKLNKIGEEIELLHETFKKLKEAGYRQGFKLAKTKDTDAKHQAIMAVIDIFDRIRMLHHTKGTYDALDNFGDYGFISKLTRKQFALRLPLAVQGYFDDGWNMVDVVNYLVFFTAIGIRVYAMGIVNEPLLKIKKLKEEAAESGGNIYAANEYVDTQAISFWFTEQTHILAVNAILTWVKLFKFLDFHPEMAMLTTTLTKAAQPLKWFMASFIIVLIGSGQGFYLAFGLDNLDYRGFVFSILALLRMAVGDFDYGALVESQFLLGPVFFWIYIVLVFFVLMSMFIAMVSEAYEDARDEADKRVPIGISGRLHHFSTWSEATHEAGKRIKLAVDNRMISHKMALDFRPFLEALEVMQKEAIKEEAATEHEKLKRRRRRRFSISNPDGQHVPLELLEQQIRRQLSGKPTVDVMYPLKDPGVSKARAQNYVEPQEGGERAGCCRRCCRRCQTIHLSCCEGGGTSKSKKKRNKYAWTEQMFKHEVDNAKGTVCQAIQTRKYNKDLPYDLAYTKNENLVITARPLEAGAQWRGYRLDDPKKKDGNIDPNHVDTDGVPPAKERPLDLSDDEISDDENEDAKTKLKELLLNCTRDTTSQSSRPSSRAGTAPSGSSFTPTSGGHTTLEDLASSDLWSTSQGALKDKIISLMQDIESLQVELKKERDENKRLVEERNKYKGQAASLSSRIATAHTASEERIPSIQRNVQMAVELLKEQQEIAGPAQHMHKLLFRKLERQEEALKHLAAAVGARSHAGVQQQQAQRAQQQAQQLRAQQQQLAIANGQDRAAMELQATTQALEVSRAQGLGGQGRRLSLEAPPQRSPAMNAALQGGAHHSMRHLGEGAIVASRLGGSASATGGRGARDLAEYEAQLAALDSDIRYPDVDER
jgi:hypothetical protein